MKETRTIAAKDGFPLEVTTWIPNSYDSVVLVGPGMGIRRNFYHGFALRLMERNLAAVTMDFRGIGGSKTGSVREVEASATTWAKQDLGGCIRWLEQTFPDTRLQAVCHSLSGQILGMVEEADRLDRIVTVVTGGGYWNYYPFPKNLAMAGTWYGLFPVSSLLLGYFPGDWLGLGENLPQGVALEVARWGRSPDYIRDYTGYDTITVPILAYSFPDDPYCPKFIVDYIHSKYSSAEIIRRHVDPTETEAVRIGHFGYFHDGNVPGLWSETIDWLKSSDTSPP